MPRGVYERKKEPEKPAEAPAANPAKKRARKAAVKPGKVPRAAASSGPSFGVFDDGSVSIILPKFSGTLTAEEARQFIGFLGRIGVKV